MATLITKEDIQKFFSIKDSYDPASPNVGVIGFKEFDKLVKKNKIFNRRKHIKMLINEEKGKITLLDEKDNTETTYIRLETYEDLIGKKFSRFI